jgi:hypothetical protein
MSRVLTMCMPKRKGAICLLVGLTLLLLVVANGHLVYVAMTSQPDCVAHLRPGSSDVKQGLFSAAQSSCSLQTK